MRSFTISRFEFGNWGHVSQSEVCGDNYSAVESPQVGESPRGDFVGECFGLFCFVEINDKVTHRPISEILMDLEIARTEKEKADRDFMLPIVMP